KKNGPRCPGVGGREAPKSNLDCPGTPPPRQEHPMTRSHDSRSPSSPRSQSVQQPRAGACLDRARRAIGACIGWAAVSGFVLDGHAWAIPSPDVVVNLFASSAQVLGLLTVIFGKWFFSSSRKAT